MFSIATNTQAQEPLFGMRHEPGNGYVDFTQNPDLAERRHRQIIEQIQCCDTPEDVDDVLHEHDETLESYCLNFPDYLTAIEDAADDWKAMLRPQSAPSGAPETAQSPETNSDSKGKAMFSINTNVGGETGPFLQYKQRAGQGMPDGSWYLRSKDGEDWHYQDMTDRFKQGFVADIYATHDGQLGGSLKMGFIKFNEGKAADRHFWASPLQAEQRPSEEKNQGGGFLWQNIVTFKVAIGGGEAALLDVSGWGGYKGMMGLIDRMNAGFSENVGKAPLIQYLSFEVEGTGQTRLHVPKFQIAQWVDLPDCLKADTPAIKTNAAPEPAPEPAPAPAPQAQPAPANASAGF